MKKEYYTNIILGVFFIFLLFSVPYLFPPTKIGLSSSYDYGFNNKVGVLLFALFSVFFICKSFLKNRKIDSIITINRKETVCSKKIFLLIQIVTSISLFVVLIFARKFYGFLEDGYFIPHLFNLKSGMMVFEDFGFAYGPIMLYIPYCIYKAIPFLTIQDAYYLTVLLSNIAGLFFLREILNFLSLDSKLKNIIFVLIAIIGFPFHLGLNYTLFRFLMPFYSFILIISSQKGDKRKFITAICVFFLSLINLCYSPELGIVFVVVIIINSFINFIFSKKHEYVIYVMIGILCIIGVYLLFPKMALMILSFTGGSLNWPFIVSLLLISFFISVFIVSDKIGIQLRSIKDNLDILSIELLAFGFIPAALGRCDPGHVFYNGYIIFILAISYVQIRCYKKYFHIFLFIAYLSFLPYTLLTTTIGYGGVLAKYSMSSAFLEPLVIKGIGLFKKQEKYQRMLARKKEYNKLIEQAVKYEKIVCPYSVPNDYYIPLLEKDLIEPLYYLNLDCIGSETAFYINLEELKKRNAMYLLLPRNYKSKSLQNTSKKVINILFSTYYPNKIKRNGNELFKIFEDFIDQKYTYYDDFGEQYIIVKRKY